jgi:cbb3-type cytochrome oxidase subunit 3
MELISNGSYFVHYAIYSKNGVGSGFLHFVGSAWDFGGELIMMVLLILIASGWGITFPTISHIQDRKVVLGISFGIFSAIYISMFFWSAFGLDPATTVYVYASTPGVIILVMRSIAMLFFAFCLWRTYKQENDEGKRNFYLRFGIVFGIWFLSLPFLAIIGQGIHAYKRAKIIYGLYNTNQAIFLSILGYLLWPSVVAKYFEVAVPSMTSHNYDQIGGL